MGRTRGLLTLTLALALAGCGSDTSTESPPPAASEVVVVSSTAGGGQVSEQVTVLDDEDAVTAYAQGFRGGMVTKITSAARGVEVADDQVLVAAVVSVGCDVPSGVEVTGSGADAEFTAQQPATPRPECFAPVTTVALAAVPA